MTSLVRAVHILKAMSPEERRLAFQLSKPDPVPRRKKPGPKPGSKRKKVVVPTPTPPSTKKSRRIEPAEPEAE